jgi:hypothetical protein
MNQKIKQVIKIQRKAKTRSLEREKSRSPKARARTQHNRDKMLQNCRLLKVRQKGLTPSAKERKSNSGDTMSSSCMNASPPKQMHFSHFSPLDAKLPLPNEMGTFLPLVGNA